MAATQPVLFVIDTGIVSINGVMSTFAELDELANVTVLYDGIETIGAEPEALADLDAAVTFNHFRASEGHWPAIDIIRSYSHAFEDDVHTAVARQAARWAERQAVIRGRRLHAFLSQLLMVAEPWSGIPATYVPLPDTIATVQAILNSELEDMPEEEVRIIGKWSPVWT